jgi:hypothetical protein
LLSDGSTCTAYATEGATEEKGEHARLASFVGAMAISDLVKSTLGPKGMDKILMSMVRGRCLGSFIIQTHSCVTFHSPPVFVCFFPRFIHGGGGSFARARFVLALTFFSPSLLTQKIIIHPPPRPTKQTNRAKATT